MHSAFQVSKGNMDARGKVGRWEWFSDAKNLYEHIFSFINGLYGFVDLQSCFFFNFKNQMPVIFRNQKLKG